MKPSQRYSPTGLRGIVRDSGGNRLGAGNAAPSFYSSCKSFRKTGRLAGVDHRPHIPRLASAGLSFCPTASTAYHAIRAYLQSWARWGFCYT